MFVECLSSAPGVDRGLAAVTFAPAWDGRGTRTLMTWVVTLLGRRCRPRSRPGPDAGPGFFHAVAVEFDGTLTESGDPGADVLAALDEAGAAGHRVVVVSGRIVAELQTAVPDGQRAGGVRLLPDHPPARGLAP